MENKSVIKILLSVSLFCLLVLSCSPEGVSKVTITIDLGLQNKAAFNTPESSSIIDRVLRFFAKDAEAQSAPNNLTSLTLNITGDGMDKITLGYAPPLPSTITVEVPAGDNRTFEVLAHTASVTFRGTAKRNLSSGATVAIPIQMALYETKIVIPDYQNQRIVQIDDMTGANWNPKDATGLNTSTIAINTLYPYDIDFDSQGRIYIANYNFSTEAAIIRIDDINDTEPEKLATTTGIVSLTMDRANNLLYFATSNTIYKIRTDITDAPIDIGVDDTELGDGNYGFSSIFFNNNSLYIANQMAQSLRRLDLTLSYPNRAVDLYSGSYNYMLGDIITKSNNVYFTVYGGGTSVVVCTSLNLVENSVLQYAPRETDSFASYGPRSFLAILNSRFYLIDEDGSGTVNRIVAFDDFNSPWDTYSGETNFRFYVC